VGRKVIKYGRKIAKFICRFPSLLMENSIYMLINFYPQGRTVMNYYSWVPFVFILVNFSAALNENWKCFLKQFKVFDVCAVVCCCASWSLQWCLWLIVIQFQGRFDTIMATSSYTAEFGAGVVVNGLDLNTDATKVLVGGRKGNICFWLYYFINTSDFCFSSYTFVKALSTVLCICLA